MALSSSVAGVITSNFAPSSRPSCLDHFSAFCNNMGTHYKIIRYKMVHKEVAKRRIVYPNEYLNSTVSKLLAKIGLNTLKKCLNTISKYFLNI